MGTNSGAARRRTSVPAKSNGDARPGRNGAHGGAGSHADRLVRLAKMVAAEKLSALLVTNPKDVAYLTGFLGGDSYLVVPASGRPVVISDFRFIEELEPVKPVAEVLIRKVTMPEALGSVFSGGGGKGGKSLAKGSIGVQAEHMSVFLRETVAAAAGSGRLMNTRGLVSRLRLTKSEGEVALIKAAVRIQEKALAAVLGRIKAGMTELEVAAEIEAEMKRGGSSAPGFETIVAAGAHGSLPHYRPGKAKLKKNSCVLIDWGAIVEGYHSDMTRTFALGAWPRKMREIYTIVRDAKHAAAALLAPGVLTSQVDNAAREHIRRAGYGEYFGHGLGHGIGHDGHEDPRLSHMGGGTTLEPWMVVTIEPGIYLPGVGGVRLEDDYVLTARGARNLCTLPDDLEWSTLPAR